MKLSTPCTAVGSHTARHAGAAAMIGLLLALAACATSPQTAGDAYVPGESCRGFAGMEVPNCDFSTPMRW